ncbi:MAG: hypothetical protein RSB76_03590 [Clostridia bacterium]
MSLALVLFGILIVFGLIFFITIKKQNNETSINKDDSKVKSKNATSKKDVDVKKEDVFQFMEFDRILDNMIVQNKGTKFTMAIKCKGINYDLMSDVEQIAVEEGFITFLNTLRYPIQLYVQAQNIDLKGAISTYKQNVAPLKEEFEKVNNEYGRLLDEFDASVADVDRVDAERTKVLNVYDYANDIISYVEKLSVNKSLLQRNFYVLVSYHTSEIAAVDSFTKDEIISISYNELLTRAQAVISGLSASSVNSIILDSNEVADLLYTAFNRDDKGLLNVKEALDSGFYRLYSTSEDAFYKKQELLIDQIENEARIKAIESIKKSIRDGTYVPPEAAELNIQEQISKTAAEMVKNEDLPNEIKDVANQILVEDFKNIKDQLLTSFQKKVNGGDVEEKVVIPLHTEEEIKEKNLELGINDKKDGDKSNLDNSFTNEILRRKSLEEEKNREEKKALEKEMASANEIIIENDDTKPDLKPEVYEEKKIVVSKDDVTQPVIDDDRLDFDDERLDLKNDELPNDDDTSDDSIIR